MKKLIIILLFVISVDSSAKSFEQRSTIYDTTKLQTILSINLNAYIGLPVDSLLSILPINYSNRGFMSVGVGYTKGIYQSYFTGIGNNCSVEIYIDTFQFLVLPNRSPKSEWNISLAKQETIAFIKVIKNNTVCLFGCNNPDYYYP